MNRIFASLVLVCPMVVVLAMATTARAVSLVVMAYNDNLTSVDPTLVGYTAYEIGVQVTEADVLAGGKDAALVVQNLTFVGDGVSSPYQSPDSVDDIQTLQSEYINADSKNAANRVGPSEKAGPDVHLGVANGGITQEDLFTDSWWYSGTNAGVLRGVFNSNGQIGTITTNKAADNSGVYAIGAQGLVPQFPGTAHSPMGTLAVGTTGYLWNPVATGIVSDSGTGTTMQMTGLFGPAGACFLNPSAGAPFSDPTHILGDMLVANGGTLTVPLAQIVVDDTLNGHFYNLPSANVLIPSDYDGGAGTFISIGNKEYNVLGGPVGVDPGASIDGLLRPPPTPEPGSFVLAAMSALGLAWAIKRRK